jgi:hypothetical protein
MRQSSSANKEASARRFRSGSSPVLSLCCLLCAQFCARVAFAQEDLGQKVQQLTDAMNRVQAQMDESKRQLDEMEQQLADLRKQMATAQAAPAPAAPQNAEAESIAKQLQAQVEDLRERQAVQEAQLSVQEQTKVESESKYPVKLSGLILMNGFVNTRMVDVPATPTLAIGGEGSTGASIRQTILGLDARGPHLFGARSHGDLRIDFGGSASATNSYAGGDGVNLVRLRTAHAALEWAHTQAFFALDRPIISPNAPDSLTALAEPALAWSGNLWSWNPQFGVAHDLALSTATSLRTQFALIDVQDAPTTPVFAPANGEPVLPPTAQLSRWPGAEARIALFGGASERGAEAGVGGFYAPHRSIGGTRFDSWAGTLDLRIPLPARMELKGAFYRGLALGGLGAGTYKDYVYRSNGIESYFLSLDDVGGWAQWKQRLSERFEANEAFGIDNVPAGQLRPFSSPTFSMFQNLARNRTFTGNVIYSPTAYLLFSLEYRRIESSPVNAPTAFSDVIGVAAGYKF